MYFETFFGSSLFSVVFVGYDRMMHTFVMGSGSVGLYNKVVVFRLIRRDILSQYIPRDVLGQYIPPHQWAHGYMIVNISMSHNGNEEILSEGGK